MHVLSEKGRFDPLSPSHPAVDVQVCPGCGELLQAGDVPSLVDPTPPPTGVPGAYTAEVQMAHERCAYPEGTDRALWTIVSVAELERLRSLVTPEGETR